MARNHPPNYQGQRVAFLTLHGKQELLRPLLQDALGCQLIHTDSFDTDQLGSFTREVPRLQRLPNNRSMLKTIFARFVTQHDKASSVKPQKT
jgi:hypothetical protein